jgi:hypothetical protein
LTDCCSVSEEEKCRTLDEIQENWKISRES